MSRRASVLLIVMLSACASAQPGGSSSAAPATGATGAPRAPILGSGETDLPAGTYGIDLTSLAGGPEYPTFEITVPDGWVSLDGWAVARPAEGQGAPSVAVTFWNVDEVYGHPCQWAGTAFQPGRGADRLAEALANVPLRDATDPQPVTVDGRGGAYLEWTVPDDVEFEGSGEFPACDETPDGHRDFRSWTGLGWAETRFQQAPGQVDRLWIIDADGQRLVIDGFSMPWATEGEIRELLDVVDSLRFFD